MSAAGRDLRCVECDREPRGDERFRAYLTIDDEVAVFWPECAEREFGGEGEPRSRTSE